jgi:hypothetical protein
MRFLHALRAGAQVAASTVDAITALGDTPAHHTSDEICVTVAAIEARGDLERSADSELSGGGIGKSHEMHDALVELREFCSRFSARHGETRPGSC